MKNRLTFNLGNLVALGIAFYLAYFLLLYDNQFHTSIAAIINYSHHLANKKHLLVLGMLPIYIATMIFGAGMLGGYFGNKLGKFFVRMNNN